MNFSDNKYIREKEDHYKTVEVWIFQEDVNIAKL
jgi:hypothetical protein